MKIDFVQKLIDFSANNEQPVVGCLAAKVVAGLEPNKTNELLQALARLAQRQLNGHLNQETASTASTTVARRPRTFTKPLGIAGKQQQPTETTRQIGSASSRRKSSGGASVAIHTPTSGASKRSSPTLALAAAAAPASPPTAAPVESSPLAKQAETNSSTGAAKAHHLAIKEQRQVVVSSESDINKGNLMHLKMNLRELKSTLDDVGQMEDSLRNKLNNVLRTSVAHPRHIERDTH